MRRYLSSAALVAALLFANAARAQDTSNLPQVTAPEACHATEDFQPPKLRWAGRFLFKAEVTVKNGRVAKAELQAQRGADDDANDRLSAALARHMEATYRCEGPDQRYTHYLVVNLRHEIPELAAQLAEWRAEKTAWQAAKAASASSAPTASPPARHPLFAVCPVMGQPVMPAVSGRGTVDIELIVQVKDGAIGLVDARLTRGSPDARVNKLFLDAVVSTVRGSYRCEGNHVFDQEFRFRLS